MPAASAAEQWAAAIQADRKSGRPDASADLPERGIFPPISARTKVAAHIRDFRLKGPGRKPDRINGHTRHNLRLADAFEHYHALVRSGHGTSAASEMTRDKFGKPTISEDLLDDVLRKKRVGVNAILRERGVISICPTE